jgi:uncharacterized phage protein (TIGR02216 family)
LKAAAGEAAGAFPWERAMALGLGLLRLAPRDFWAMTPRELAAVTGAGQRGTGPTRDELTALAARFPDI